MMDYNGFITLAKSLLPGITPEMESRFQALEELYNEWNAKINVISRKDIGSLYMRHVMHSLAIAGYLEDVRPEMFEGLRAGQITDGCHASVLDIGTGGGFPGIPLAILFPDVNFTLCDSVGKKTIVAEAVASALGLDNVKVVNARAESLNETFDFVVSRAVTALDNFYPWAAGKYRQSILYLKGGDFSEELCRMMSAARLAPGSVRTWKIQDWIDDPMFEEKFVIDIPSGKGGRAPRPGHNR
ncbi:MAG: 16S rRNA (guanine(527)-N(7))-methyltransferase RsmG [Candidatus Cryptobacteroides sp.]